MKFTEYARKKLMGGPSCFCLNTYFEGLTQPWRRLSLLCHIRHELSLVIMMLTCFFSQSETLTRWTPSPNFKALNLVS